LLLALALSSCHACAETASPGTPGVTAGVMLQTVLGLLFILGLLFFAAYLLRKINGGRGFGSSGPLRVVGGLMLSTRERIVLIEVGDTWLVLGVGPGQLRTLHTMPKGEVPLPATGEKPFAQWLKQITERKNETK
jgi:flagellar protein FliO/FliZ